MRTNGYKHDNVNLQDQDLILEFLLILPFLLGSLLQPQHQGQVGTVHSRLLPIALVLVLLPLDQHPIELKRPPQSPSCAVDYGGLVWRS